MFFGINKFGIGRIVDILLTINYYPINIQHMEISREDIMTIGSGDDKLLSLKLEIATPTKPANSTQLQIPPLNLGMSLDEYNRQQETYAYLPNLFRQIKITGDTSSNIDDSSS